jgi:hypothetical protein
MARGLAKRIKEGVQAGRSPAYQWFWANYHEISQVAGVRGSWKGIREAAIEAGVKIKDGELPTMPALRSAWRRVEADKAKSVDPPPSRKKKTTPKKPTTPPVAARPSVHPGPTSRPDDVEDIRKQLAGSARKIPDPL